MSSTTIHPSQSAHAQQSTPAVKKPAIARRHDLDALRAIAMLLGIVLHVALSFSTIPWTVTDSQTSGFYKILFSAIHGFRMPLFFMLSGFFTAMLWRKRTLSGLIRQRVKRILLPLVIGCFTIVPAVWVVGSIASRPSSGSTAGSSLFTAVVTGDVGIVRSELDKPGTDVDAADPASGSTPLATAVFIGHTEIVELLIEAKASVNLPNRDRACPLHIAAFMGRGKEAALLLAAGADVTALNGQRQTPEQLLAIDFGTTAFIAGSLGVQLDEDTLMAGRREVAMHLGAEDAVPSGGSQPDASAMLYGLLFQMPVFMHLWFLAFLCWLVIAFVPYTVAAKAIRIERLPKWIVCSPANLLWLVPLTMVPLSFMQPAVFGPDSSVGLLPQPAVIAFYAIFFFFGALYWEVSDTDGQLGRLWAVGLPLALLVVFPAGLDLIDGTFGFMPKVGDSSTTAVTASLFQALFAWLMIFGSIGLFRQTLSQESRTLRYISDSSYWLYVAHLPLVILAQWFVRDWQLPAFVKFAGITVVISGFLLLTYECGVRYTVIGRLLNGPRTRERAVTASAEQSVS